MNITSLATENYEKWTLGHIRQTNPIQTQFMVSKVEPFYRGEAPGEAGSNPALPVLSVVEGSVVEGPVLSFVEGPVLTALRSFSVGGSKVEPSLVTASTGLNRMSLPHMLMDPIKPKFLNCCKNSLTAVSDSLKFRFPDS
jgi:hypothetical protein